MSANRKRLMKIAQSILGFYSKVNNMLSRRSGLRKILLGA